MNLFGVGGDFADSNNGVTNIDKRFDLMVRGVFTTANNGVNIADYVVCLCC